MRRNMSTIVCWTVIGQQLLASLLLNLLSRSVDDTFVNASFTSMYNQNSFLSHIVHEVVLISVFLAISQTPVYTPS